MVSGVGLMAYWFTNFLVDYMKFCLLGAVALLSLIFFDISVFLTDYNWTMSA